MKRTKRTSWFGYLILLIAITLLGIHFFMPPYLERSMNRVETKPPISYSTTTTEFHDSLTIMDWHANSTLWSRDLVTESDYGHVDLPRLQHGNMAIQMFTAVTKVPTDNASVANSNESSDLITTLAMVQAWPLVTWSSLFERALYQAERIHEMTTASNEFYLIKTKDDMNTLLGWRNDGLAVVGAMLGINGSHVLEGGTLRFEELYEAGFRMMSLHHLFDNKAGGSLHSISDSGLTDFGNAVVREIQKNNLILDLAFSSPAVVADVLEFSSRPVIVSHTGLYGHCPNANNLADELLLEVAGLGGLVAISFRPEAVCGNSVADIASAIHYAIDLLGVDHVALGSGFDSVTTTAIDSSDMLALTDALFNEGLTRKEIAQVMGQNSISFLRDNLPN